MKISLRYKRAGSDEWIERAISPAEYFEPCTEGRPFEWDDVPEHLHAVDYLQERSDEIRETELRILDPGDRWRLTVTETLWNEGRDRIIHCVEPELTLWIVQLRVEGEDTVWHTVRLHTYTDGRKLLEHTRVLESNGMQRMGPGFSTTSFALPRVSWDGDQNEISLHVSSEATTLALRLQTGEHPDTSHAIRLDRGEDGHGHLQHDVTTTQDGAAHRRTLASIDV